MRKLVLFVLALWFFALVLFLSTLSKPSDQKSTSVLTNLIPREEHSALSEYKWKPGDPILAWAGQRVVLTKDWKENGMCPWGNPGSEFLVNYDRTAGPGKLIDGVGQNSVNPDSQTVRVLVNKARGPNSDCTSHLIYTADDAGEIDINITVIDENGVSLSPPVAQILYYMKLEDISISPDEEGDWVSSDGADYSRVRVRGWIMTVEDNGTIVVHTFDWGEINYPVEQSSEPEYLCGGVLPPQYPSLVAALPTESRTEKLKTARKVIL